MFRLLIWACAAGLLIPAICTAQTDPLGPDVVPALSRVEVARIGGLDERPEYELTTVSGAVVLPSGDIALADRTTREIRIFNAAGKFLRKMGREGDGPGEFRAIRQIVRQTDDRILSWDIQRRRVSVFSAEGELEDTWLLNTEGLGVLFPSFVGAFPDGRVVIRVGAETIGMRDGTPGMRRDSIAFLVFEAGGELRTQTPPVEGPERRFYRDGTSWGTDQLLLARDLASAVTGAGLVVGHTDSLHLRLFDPSKGWVSHLRIGRAAERASRRVIEAERAVRMQDAETRAQAPPDARSPFPTFRREAAQREIKRLEDLDHYRTVPAFGGLLAASDGSLWVSDYPDFVQDIVHWYLFVESRRLVGRTSFSTRERVVGAGFGLLLTIVEDEFDLETMIVYRLGGSDAPEVSGDGVIVDLLETEELAADGARSPLPRIAEHLPCVRRSRARGNS